MRRQRSTIFLGTLAATVVAVGVATWIGARRQQRMLSANIERLMRPAVPYKMTQGPDLGLAKVPAPVARYLRLALPNPKWIQWVRIQQTGTLRIDLDSQRWMRFEAEHVAVPPATGFVWNARVRLAPLLHVRVRDSFIEGTGSGRVSLLSAFVVGADGDTPEMNSGSMHRYLAEAVWYPTALVPSPQLTWTEIDAVSSLATLTNHGVTVSLVFRFAETGEVIGIYTPGRWGSFQGGYRQAPWEGHFRDYRERNGIVVPTEGDVGWYVNDEWRPVWRGRVTRFELGT